MLDSVKDAFEMLYEEQKETGWNDVEIDGMRGFIFCNRFGNAPNPQSVMVHKDIQTTMDIYAEATEEKKQESFERLAATLDVF